MEPDHLQPLNWGGVRDQRVEFRQRWQWRWRSRLSELQKADNALKAAAGCERRPLGASASALHFKRIPPPRRRVRVRVRFTLCATDFNDFSSGTSTAKKLVQSLAHHQSFRCSTLPPDWLSRTEAVRGRSFQQTRLTQCFPLNCCLSTAQSIYLVI